jgi:hypothetical protein
VRTAIAATASLMLGIAFNISLAQGWFQHFPRLVIYALYGASALLYGFLLFNHPLTRAILTLDGTRSRRLFLDLKARRLASKIERFLTRMGPRPDVVWSTSASDYDNLTRIVDVRTPWDERIHFTYYAKFQLPLTRLINELHAEGFHDYDIDHLMERQVQNPESLHQVATKLRALASAAAPSKESKVA